MIAGRRRGLVLVFAAGALYSTAGLFTRVLALDAWTILAWRSVFGALFLLAWLAAAHGRGIARAVMIGRGEALNTPVFALGIVCYIFALKLASVAEVMVVYATLPFVTALIGWLWTGEAPTRRLATASAVALAGVAAMVSGGVSEPGHLSGILLTLLMNLCFAVTLLRARRGRASAIPAYFWSVVLSACVSFAFAPAEFIGARAFTTLAVFGVLTLGLAMALYLAGARLIPAAEVALVGTIDVVVGPGLVWLVFGQAPGAATGLGGALVLGALVWHLWPDVRGGFAT